MAMVLGIGAAGRRESREPESAPMLNEICKLPLVDNPLHPVAHAIAELSVREDVEPVFADGGDDVVRDFGRDDVPREGRLDGGRELVGDVCRASDILRAPLEL